MPRSNAMNLDIHQHHAKIGAMTHPSFFGYGSLVNRATHDYPRPQRATATGWQRVWQHTTVRPLAYLSVQPAPGVSIDGLVADVPGDEWTALDLRETGYVRLDATADVSHEAPRRTRIAIYSVPQPVKTLQPLPILLSYIDVVTQGFLREYGPQGAQRFFATTQGWDAPILDDRADPQYSRHQRLSTSERLFVDTALDDLNVRYLRT